jgi:hypothetical protein
MRGVFRLFTPRFRDLAGSAAQQALASAVVISSAWELPSYSAMATVTVEPATKKAKAAYSHTREVRAVPGS